MSRIEKMMKAIIDETSYDEEPQSRIEKQLISILKDEPYEDDLKSRIEVLIELVRDHFSGGGTPAPTPADVYKDYPVQIEVDNISVLPANVFSGFVNLQAVKLGSGLIEIGDYAFYGCTSLPEIDVPSSVTSIGEKAIGYDSNGEFLDGFVLYGQYGTAAEEYALNNNIAFADKYVTFSYELTNVGGIDYIAFNGFYGDRSKVVLPYYFDGYPVRVLYREAFNTSKPIISLDIRAIHDVRQITSSSGLDARCLPPTLKTLYLGNRLTTIASSTSWLSKATSLENIILENNFDYGLHCSNTNPLTHDCLVNMLNSLRDRSDLTAKTLTIGSANLAKLSNAEKAVATEKNWTLA